MSSHNRERAFEMRRSKGTMSDYRSAPVSKSRSEMSSRKKVFSSRDPPMEEKHREYLKPSKRGIEDRREYDERKDYPPMKKSRENYQGGTKESYGRSTRDESFESKNRDPYLSRGSRDSFSGTRGSMSGRGSYGSSSRGGRGSFGSSRGSRESFPMRNSKPLRESYPSRGSYGGFPRGSRDSYSSRGSFAPSRGRGESFSSRGRESYSARGRELYSGRGRDSSRGGEPYSVRGRDSYSSRGSEPYSGRGRESFLERGRESYSARGRDMYSARGRDIYPSRGMKTSSRGGYNVSKRVSKYDDFGSNSSNSRTSYEMSKKMSSMNEDHYEDDRMYALKRSSRSFIEKDTARTFKEPSSVSRSFMHHHSSSSLSGEKYSHKRERSSSASSHYDKERYPEHISKRKSSKDKFEASTKRSYDEDDDEIGRHSKDHRDGPPLKQQRLIKKEKYRDANSQEYHHTRSSSPLHIKEEKVRERTQERDRSKSRASERAKKREERVSKGSVGADGGESVSVEESERRRPGRVKSREICLEDVSVEDSAIHEDVEEEKVLPPDEEEHEGSYERLRERSPGGVQITIRSDGERAVNSDGFVKQRLSGKVFVDLRCPHCPGQNSITFAKYRYHLDSRSHRHKIENLAYKHSIVLRRIRRQQRSEQKEIEEKWETEKPEEFKNVTSTYCKMCKLAFKSLPDRIDEHNESKLHKIQQRYLHPKCEMCRMSFPSRMVYEYHIASIRHLRMLSMCNKNGHDGTPEDETKEDNKEEIDLTNFITMDSVGEDEEVGSEKEEITGNLEDIEKAEEDAKEGEEEDEHAELEEAVEDDDFVMDVEDEADLQEQEEEQFEPAGKDYVEPMEAVYCKLCHKAIRVDTELGEELIDRHCCTAAHIDNLQLANSREYIEGEEEEEEEEDNFEEAGENVIEGDVVVEELEEEEEEDVKRTIDIKEEENPEDRQDYEEEDEPNYEEVMEEHGEDIDLDEKKPIKLEDVKENGK